MDRGKKNRIQKIAEYFGIPGELLKAKPLGNGHINETLLLTFQNGKEEDRYVLQKINRYVFQKPEELMENMVNVTGFLRKKITARGGDASRETLTVLTSPEGSSLFIDEEGGYRRITKYIDETLCYERAETPSMAYMTGEAFGGFLKDMSDYPAASLFETIPGFHDTLSRLRQFEQAVCEDKLGRAKNCKKEIDFLRSRKELAGFAAENFAKGLLPLRVTHNDTKFNNILIDKKTGRPLCILDLDTVMPGFSLYDFGDMIRSGTNTAGEAEKDLSLVRFDRELYEAFRKGYLAGTGGCLTKFEEEALPMGARISTYEQALRFLADHLSGDAYFRAEYREHNLVRTRTQIRMLQEMEKVL